MESLPNEMRKYLNLLEWGTPESMDDPATIPDLTHAATAYVYGKAMGFHADELEKLDWEASGSVVGRIDQVFQEQMPILRYSHHVCRGMYLRSWEHLDDRTDFRTKDAIKFRSYVSTSENYETAEEIMLTFGHQKTDPGVYIMFYIKTLKGARGMEMNEYMHEDYLKYYEDQEEILLDRSAAFRVVAKEQKKPYWTKNTKNMEFWVVNLEQTQ